MANLGAVFFYSIDFRDPNIILTALALQDRFIKFY